MGETRVGRHMERWLHVLTRVHHSLYPVVGLCGLAATVLLAEPGTHVVTVGFVHVDVFYAAVAGFGMLLLLSLTDEYDAEEYDSNR